MNSLDALKESLVYNVISLSDRGPLRAEIRLLNTDRATSSTFDNCGLFWLSEALRGLGDI